MSGAPVLSNFRVHLPAHRGSHADIVRWLAAAHARSEETVRAGDPGFDPGAFRRQMERHLRRFAPSPETVGFRYSEIDEFLDEDFSRKELFPLDRVPQGASTGARMDAFAGFAERALRALYDPGSDDGAAPPGEILHVTCTGYAAPSAPQVLVEERGWHSATRVTHAYHMGCYAALPAVRIAAGYLASGRPGGFREEGRCDIVHTEVCSLHLNPARHDPEQLVVQSLFADGFIRYSLRDAGREGEGGAPEGGRLEVLGFAERIVPRSLADIRWSPGDFGMRMTLSRDVPDKVGPELDAFADGLARASGLARTEIDQAVWAVHPGGPRIVDKVEEWMKLDPRRLLASREILFERGNMSSATLPHIWDRILRDPSVAPGTPVVSLAFGPGLTLYGAVMRKL